MAERIFRGFLFLSRRIFSRIFSPDFFSSFSWEKVRRKVLQENPRENPPKFIQQKSPTHFCRGAVPLRILGQYPAVPCSPSPFVLLILWDLWGLPCAQVLHKFPRHTAIFSKSASLSGPLNRLNAMLFLLRPLDRYLNGGKRPPPPRF